MGEKIDAIISENINRFLLREYLDKEYMIPFMDNMNLLEKEKIWHNVYENLNMVYDFLGLNYDKIEDRVENDDNYKIKCVNRLIKKYPTEIVAYCNSKSELYAISHPTNLMMENPSLFKNGWVIHFTDRPYGILRDGFHGLSSHLIDRLWRTYNVAYQHSKGEGYGFAYDINDYDGLNIYDEPLSPNTDYGEYGIIFRTSGIKVRHKIDGDYQVIFNTAQANLKDCILLHITRTLNQNSGYNPYDDNSVQSYHQVYEIINPINQKVYYKSDNFHKAVMWAINNRAQYKKLNTFSPHNNQFIKTQKENEIQKYQKYIEFFKTCDGLYADVTLVTYGDEVIQPRNTDFQTHAIGVSDNKAIWAILEKMMSCFKMEDGYTSTSPHCLQNDEVQIDWRVCSELPYSENACWKKKYGDMKCNKYLLFSFKYDYKQ